MRDVDKNSLDKWIIRGFNSRVEKCFSIYDSYCIIEKFTKAKNQLEEMRSIMDDIKSHHNECISIELKVRMNSVEKKIKNLLEKKNGEN